MKERVADLTSAKIADRMTPALFTAWGKNPARDLRGMRPEKEFFHH